MKRYQKITPIEREAWLAARDALDRCRAGAIELDRLMAGTRQAVRSADLFMERITTVNCMGAGVPKG